MSLQAGGRGYYLKREGVFLNQALIQFALHHGYSKGMLPIMTPFLMRQGVMAACAQLSQFDEELYKATGIPVLGLAARYLLIHLAWLIQKNASRAVNMNEASVRAGEGEDKYLIATAEQPLCAMHKDCWLEEKELPIRYIGYSTCFRKEAGSHGRETAGIFRSAAVPVAAC